MKTKLEILKNNYFKVPFIDNFKDLLYRSAETFKNKPVFRLKDANGKLYEISYKKLKEDVIAFGTHLINIGCKDKKIALIGKNSYQWAVSYLASSIVGVVVPIDKELHHDDVINFINASEASMLISDKKNLKPITDNKSNINNEIKFININNSSLADFSFDNFLKQGYELVKDGNTSFEEIKINPEDMHILLFTSGTTGNSKGVCLSHKNICYNIMAIAKTVKVDCSTVVLSILPIHHTYECTIGFLLILFGGGTISFCDGLKYISKNIQEYKPSFILCVPLLLENVHSKILKSLKSSLPEKFFKNDIHIMDTLPFYLKPIVKAKIKKSLGGKMRTFIVGAAAINPDVVESFVKFGFKVLQGYGLTECSPLVAGNNDFFYKAAAAGMPIPYTEYKIDNPDSEGVGEIIVKGENVMLGYYNDPEETNKVIIDGWFHTGDLGRIDEDGFLYITGRCKSVIVTKNGKNIYPEEIEYYLNDNPLILESIVLGVPNEEDDDVFIKAKILPDMDAIKDYLKTKTPSTQQITNIINSIVQAINEKLPNYKHLKGYKIIDSELEKTTTKKIKRFGKNIDMNS